MPFGFRHQPLKFFYISWTAATLLLVRLPYWLVTNLAPKWRPRPSWGLRRTLIVNVYRVFIGVIYNTGISPPKAPAAIAAGENGFVVIEPTPSLISSDILGVASQNGVQPIRTGGYWYGDKPESGHIPGSKVFYHFHGGAFVMGTGNPQNSSMQTIYKGLVEHCPKSSVFALEYRLCSSSPYENANAFPAALLDAIAGYNYLIQTLQFHPKDIIVSGDSAGGTLAHALALYLVRNRLPDMDPPGGLLLLSPTVDWGVTHTGPHSSMEKHARSDFVGEIFSSGYTVRSLMGRLPAGDIDTNEWLSPASLKLRNTSGLFTGYPGTFILAGGAEMTLDGMVTLRDRMVADMGEEKVTYLEVADSTHDFLAATWHEPERTLALKRIATWYSNL